MNRKAKHARQDVSDDESPREPKPALSKKIVFSAPGLSTPSLLGTQFTSAIEGVKEGTRAEGVFTSFSLPYQISGGMGDREDSKRLTASFHTNTHVNKSGKIWTQGMLETGKGDTSYAQVIPEKLSLDRATFEGRAMKRLATDDYDPARKRSTLVAQEVRYAGNIALQSYLEDVTAKRGLGFDRVGSAMRAATMAEKWAMKEQGSEESRGFADGMKTAFPQLREDGATDLWDRLKGRKGEDSQVEALEAHLGLEGSIHQAHVRAHEQAYARFQTKFGETGMSPSGEDVWAYTRRKLERHGIAYAPTAQETHALPDAPTALRGEDFLQGIANLANGVVDLRSKPMFTELSLPYHVKDEPDDSLAFKFGTFSSKTRLNKGSTNPWTQGMMEPSMNTSYFGETKKKFTGSIPDEISLNRATMESRAMKFLSMTDYEFPTDEHKRVEVSTQEEGKRSGELTMGSFLEDITSQRALGFSNSGSAMRSLVMEAKWTMKELDQQEMEGFGTVMLEGLPQLGKKAWKGNKYGAKNLWQNLQDGKKRNDILDHHKDSIANAHFSAEDAAGDRFDTKFARFQDILSDQPLTKRHTAVKSQLGKWWNEHGKAIAKIAAMPRGTKEERSLYREAVSKRRAAYVDTKLARHAIATYDGETKKPIKPFTGK